MVNCNSVPILRRINIDDGTTGGKDVIQTVDGQLWEETYSSEKSAPTGTIIGHSNGKSIIW